MNLVGFRNRLMVLIQWAGAYISFQRSVRLITGREAGLAPPRARPRADGVPGSYARRRYGIGSHRASASARLPPRFRAACRRTPGGAADTAGTSRPAPSSPTGSKIAVWRIVVLGPSARTSNSSQARPGSFISADEPQPAVRARAPRRARNRPYRPRAGSAARAVHAGAHAAREQIEDSRAAARASSTRTSRCRRQCAEWAGRRRAGGTRGVSTRESTSRRTRPAPPATAGRRADDSASDQRVGANRRSSLARARRTASLTPDRADGEGCVARASSLTTVRVDDALHELAADPRVERRHEAQPQAREVRRQQGHRDHPEAALPRGRAYTRMTSA